VEGYFKKALSYYDDPSDRIITLEKEWRDWYDSIKTYRP
jgi:hypothetical protein